MPFSPPTFNLLCNIYTGPWIGKLLRVGLCPCNLALGRRVQLNFSFDPDVVNTAPGPNLLLPPGTDVRDRSNASGWDVVEVPAGTGRWYAVSVADDVGKGFANEYRIAVIGKISEGVDSFLFPGLWWPTPIP